MGRSFAILRLTIATALLSSCVRPVVTRRYRIQTPIANAPIAVRFTAFCLDVPVAFARTTLLNLADRGQASLIQELGEKSTDARELLGNLGSPIVFSQDPGGVIDHTRFERRVVFSIDDQSPGPADRITQARIRLTIPALAKFNSWTQFATKYETADLGSLKFTQNREIDLNVAGGTVVNAGA